MTETKTDVFNLVLTDMTDATEFDPHPATEYWRSRYAAAPADEVKVPRDVNEYIKWGKEYSLPLYMMMSFKFIRSQKFEKLTDAVESWIIDYSEQFASAWLAWPNMEVEK